MNNENTPEIINYLKMAVTYHSVIGTIKLHDGSI